MKLTIKNLKTSEFASEETLCFEATVYVDGKRAFIARNDGHGGGNYYHAVEGYNGPSERNINEWMKANRPAVEFEGMTLEHTMDWEVDELIAQIQQKKTLDRMLRSKTILIAKHEGNDAIFTVKGKPTEQRLEQIRKAIAAGKLTGTIVNGDAAAYDRALALV